MFHVPTIPMRLEKRPEALKTLLRGFIIANLVTAVGTIVIVIKTHLHVGSFGLDEFYDDFPHLVCIRELPTGSKLRRVDAPNASRRTRLSVTWTKILKLIFYSVTSFGNFTTFILRIELPKIHLKHL